MKPKTVTATKIVERMAEADDYGALAHGTGVATPHKVLGRNAEAFLRFPMVGSRVEGILVAHNFFLSSELSPALGAARQTSSSNQAGDVFLLWAASSMLRVQKNTNIQVRRANAKCLPPEKCVKALGMRPTGCRPYGRSRGELRQLRRCKRWVTTFQTCQFLTSIPCAFLVWFKIKVANGQHLSVAFHFNNFLLIQNRKRKVRQLYLETFARDSGPCGPCPR